MDTIKVLDWVLAGLFTLAGAFLGSYWAARFAQRQAEQSRLARCQILCKALRHELDLLSDQMPPFEMEKMIYEPPIRLAAIAPLLDGNTLDSRADGGLLEALLVLQARVFEYSAYVETVNPVRYGLLMAEDHRKIYDAICERRQQIGAARAEVLRHLPPDDA